MDKEKNEKELNEKELNDKEVEKISGGGRKTGNCGMTIAPFGCHSYDRNVLQCRNCPGRPFQI